MALLLTDRWQIRADKELTRKLKRFAKWKRKSTSEAVRWLVKRAYRLMEKEQQSTEEVVVTSKPTKRQDNHVTTRKKPKLVVTSRLARQPVADVTTAQEDIKFAKIQERILEKQTTEPEEESDNPEEAEEELEDEPISYDPSTWREFEYPEPEEGSAGDSKDEEWDEE